MQLVEEAGARAEIRARNFQRRCVELTDSIHTTLIEFLGAKPDQVRLAVPSTKLPYDAPLIGAKQALVFNLEQSAWGCRLLVFSGLGRHIDMQLRIAPFAHMYAVFVDLKPSEPIEPPFDKAKVLPVCHDVYDSLMTIYENRFVGLDK